LGGERGAAGSGAAAGAGAGAGGGGAESSTTMLTWHARRERSPPAAHLTSA
jgi:hypothetical protein